MKGEPILRTQLVQFYEKEHLSGAQIAQRLGCSTNKVHYWIARRGIKPRSRSDASYIKHNPLGDPFCFSKPKTISDAILFGVGLGLYWGEGNKRNRMSVRLGNTDPKLIKIFLNFLNTTYAVKRSKIRFGLQIFSDMKPQAALEFWSKTLGFPKSHFGKIVVTPARGVGTYKEKTRHGVLTVYFSNKKLRDLLNSQIESL